MVENVDQEISKTAMAVKKLLSMGLSVADVVAEMANVYYTPVSEAFVNAVAKNGPSGGASSMSEGSSPQQQLLTEKRDDSLTKYVQFPRGIDRS